MLGTGPSWVATGLLGIGEGVLLNDSGLGDVSGAYDDGDGQLLDP